MYYLTQKIIQTLLVLSLLSLPVLAKSGVYQTAEDFLVDTFAQNVPSASVLWITKSRRAVLSDILQHAPRQLRMRYWQQAEKTVWILEEVGKDEIITTAYVIEKNVIQRVKVLIFRESRGWEVRYSFFTQQFINLGLLDNQQLNGTIDNISGATLSVRALKKLARVALYLQSQI